MDLNQLLFHHQLALIKFTASPIDATRRGSYFDLVRHYERRIARLREEMGVSGYPGLA